MSERRRETRIGRDAAGGGVEGEEAGTGRDGWDGFGMARRGDAARGAAFGRNAGGRRDETTRRRRVSSSPAVERSCRSLISLALATRSTR